MQVPCKPIRYRRETGQSTSRRQGVSARRGLEEVRAQSYDACEQNQHTRPSSGPLSRAAPVNLTPPKVQYFNARHRWFPPGVHQVGVTHSAQMTRSNSRQQTSAKYGRCGRRNRYRKLPAAHPRLLRLLTASRNSHCPEHGKRPNCGWGRLPDVVDLVVEPM